ncbi:MAG: hypothetical protein ACI8VC_002619 [Candidatus Endobugula sp.]|jgi:hypothetical protein
MDECLDAVTDNDSRQIIGYAVHLQETIIMIKTNLNHAHSLLLRLRVKMINIHKQLEANRKAKKAA